MSSYVDGVLVQWGERWDWSAQSSPAKGIKSTTGTIILPRPKKSPSITAAGVRNNLKAYVRKSPQVMVKISGGAKGLSKVMNHVSYISRNGKIHLEDQDGQDVDGKDGLDELRHEWAYGGYPIPEGSDYRESINIVLSMPEGTDELAVLRAARDFAKQEFGDNHQYVMALHTYSTDPSKDPSRNPHVHLAVKSRGLDGTRLNPRKGDLGRWREGFAAALREHGTDAVATRRRGRLQKEKGMSQAVKHLQARGEVPKRQTTAKPQTKAVSKAHENESLFKREFKQMVEALLQSDAADRRLANDLLGRLRESVGVAVKKAKEAVKQPLKPIEPKTR
jgi:Relaxase/Mobilisation nuclease domain